MKSKKVCNHQCKILKLCLKILQGNRLARNIENQNLKKLKNQEKKIKVNNFNNSKFSNTI